MYNELSSLGEASTRLDPVPKLDNERDSEILGKNSEIAKVVLDSLPKGSEDEKESVASEVECAVVSNKEVDMLPEGVRFADPSLEGQ